jgi:hypothetical protein
MSAVNHVDAALSAVGVSKRLVKAEVKQTGARRGLPKNCPRNSAPHQSHLCECVS